MPFVWTGGEEPILEKRRRERAESRLADLHFKWLDAVAAAFVVELVEATRHAERAARDRRRQG